MAYLNLRERRVEATIAYVGPDLVGRATNLECLRGVSASTRISQLESSNSEAGERLSFAWQPLEISRFRDCDVHVRVVAPSGPSTESHYRDVLGDVDGVVVVLSAGPLAHEENVASLAALRDALRELGDRRNVPVVVQLNAPDASDEALPEALAEELGASDYPTIVADATRGEGVVETLEAALERALEALRSGPSPESEPEAGASAPRSDAGPPLLTALREVLRETVSQHAEGLELRVTARLEGALERLERRVSTLEDVGASLLGTATSDELVVLASRIDEIRGGVEQVVAVAAGTATRKDLSSVASALAAVREDLRTEVVRSIEVRGRTDRDHLTASTSTLKKAIESAVGELRENDPAESLAEILERLAAVEQRAAEQRAAELATAAAVKQTLAAILEGVETTRAELAGHLAASNRRVEGVQQRLTELIEEMQKPKKGWFT